MIKKHIARITDTMLGYEDHGIFTLSLGLDYGNGSHQGAGLKALGGEYTDKEIQGILNVCKVRKWEDLVGRTVYAYADHRKVYALEQLPIDGTERHKFDEDFLGWE